MAFGGSIMPLYEYRCEGCGEQFEVKQSVNARAEETVCPHCHVMKATRLMSSPRKSSATTSPAFLK
ncbi:MAG: zinc ribbon domain-containing protein [Nitrospiraceae bacterium]